MRGEIFDLVLNIARKLGLSRAATPQFGSDKRDGSESPSLDASTTSHIPRDTQAVSVAPEVLAQMSGSPGACPGEGLLPPWVRKHLMKA